jgi:hypothetical protein
MNYTQLITEALEYQKGKVCTKCKEHQPLSEFYKKCNTKDGLDYKCKSCGKEYDDNMCRLKYWFKTIKAQAPIRGREFTILPTDIPGVKIREIKTYFKTVSSWEATEYPKVCPVFGVELDWKVKVNGGQNNSPSLDRIDSTKGYVKGNVMIMSKLANSMKQNATTEQLNQFSRYHLFGDNNEKDITEVKVA